VLIFFSDQDTSSTIVPTPSLTVEASTVFAI